MDNLYKLPEKIRNIKVITKHVIMNIVPKNDPKMTQKWVKNGVFWHTPKNRKNDKKK